jgi:hypothetical protein
LTFLIRFFIQNEQHSRIFWNPAAFSHVTYYLLNIAHVRDLLNKFLHDSLGLHLSFDVILEDVLVEKEVEAARTEKFLEVLHELFVVLAVVLPSINHHAIEKFLARGMVLVVVGIHGELLEFHFYCLGLGLGLSLFKEFLSTKFRLVQGLGGL